jgi:hypothetical protein
MDNLLGQISSKLGSKSNLQVVTELKQVGQHTGRKGCADWVSTSAAADT